MTPIRTTVMRLPGWVVPVMFLLALALLPFAILLAVGLGALALGAALVGSLLKGPLGPVIGEPKGTRRSVPGEAGSKVIDAEYEVKDRDAKES
jgi:hypothetical protein